jgi:molecular chaperone DnaK
LIDARNQGEALVHSTDKHLKDFGDKVSPAEKAEIEGALEGLKEALKAEDVEDIKNKTNALSQSAMKLGEAMYKAQQAEAAQAGGAGGAGGTTGPGTGAGTAANEGQGGQGGGEHVVDAEFEDVTDKNKKTGSGS